MAYFIIIFFTYSCVKDHSPLEIDKLNVVTIKGISDTVTVSMGDTLKINPILEMSANSNTSYDYLWYSFTQNMQFSADTLSKEKNLVAPIKLVPGTYTLVYRVMDRNTGIFYKSTVSLVIVNEFTPGIMVLGEDKGKAVLNFLNTATGKYITDVYKKSNNGEELGTNPVSVSYYPKNHSMPGEVLVICRDQRGGVFADPITFSKFRNLKNSFYVPFEEASNMDITAYVIMGNNIQDYIIIDGKPHNRAVNTGDVLFKPALLANGDYHAGKIVFNDNNSARPTFYDTIGRRFLAHNNTFGSLNSFKTSPTDNIIDPNNVGLDIIYGGGAGGTEFFGVFKTPGTENYYLLRMQMDAFSLSFTAIDKYVINVDEIKKANTFASSPSLTNYLFYTVGGKCYVFNILTKSGGLLFDMGAEYSINFLEMNNNELKMAFINNYQVGKKAGFATFDITTDGGIKAKETRRKEGVMDRIVDLTDKQ